MNPYVAGTMGAFQVWSGVQQSSLIKKQGRLQQQIADMNAKYADYDAYEAEKYGYTEIARYQTMVDSTVSDQKVAMAAQGVDVSDGTAAELIAETRFTGFLNALDMENAARSKALGIKMQAANYRLGGYMEQVQNRIDSNSAMMSGILGAAKTGAGALSGYKGSGITETPSSSVSNYQAGASNIVNI